VWQSTVTVAVVMDVWSSPRLTAFGVFRPIGWVLCGSRCWAPVDL